MFEGNITIMETKKNYLNNRELLKEIHKSKMSFCWIKDKKYYDYDIILENVDSVSEEQIEEARQNRAKRLSTEEYYRRYHAWDSSADRSPKTKPKLADVKIDPQTIPLEDIVVRVMTYDHIPLEKRKNTPKSVADNHKKCNFPPFKHYGFIDGKWQETARSHWQGDLETGEFSTQKGKMTNRLGSMMIMMCNRYSMKGNWRGYSYVDEMRSNALVQLSQIGLYFDESKGNNPFSYYTSALTNSFTGVLNSERKMQSIRDDLLQGAGYMPSYTRQLNDELAQQTARKEYYDKIEQDNKDFGINI